MRSLVRYRIGRTSALELLVGDIVDEATDAIVNAANSSLLGGGGVDGAIHRAAGPQLHAECRKLRERRGPLPPGQAVTTGGANLKAKYVIHTVGPVWNSGNFNEPQILESCYCNALGEAGRQACLSVAFPSISTGAFGYPVEPAARIAVRAVARLIHEPASVTLARFVLFDERTHRAYSQAAAELVEVFPHFQIVAETKT
ncbi:MAG TPA: O-acetyl-ADP-ribose deacetylase [Candidatus Angelobacter sp.]|nr:O-acetyl-ADP-ribose deacetylase [Candidatus Angelobacter sp.]